MLEQSRIRTAVLAVSGLALILGIGSAVLSHQVKRQLVERVSNDAFLTASSFADAVGMWLEEDETRTLRRVSQLMLAGSSLFIHIVDRDQVIVNETHDSVVGAIQLVLPAEAAAPGSSYVELMQLGDIWMMDLYVPLFGRSQEETQSYVRSGMDVGFLKSKVVAARLRIAAFALGIWGLAVAALAARTLLTRKRAHTSGIDEPSDDVEPSVIQRGRLRIDLSMKAAWASDKALNLPPNPYRLLRLLVQEEHRVVPEQDIIDAVWPPSFHATSTDVRQCVHRLRKALRTVDPGTEQCIVNVKGFGYRFDSSLCPEDITTGRGSTPASGSQNERSHP